MSGSQELKGGDGSGVVVGRGRALRQNRDFRLLWIGQTVSGLGGSMSSVAYPLIALALTHSAVDAGLVGLANTAPFVLLQLPAGLYVDRWNRRAILLLSDAGRALAVGGVCVLLFLGHLAFWELVAAAVVEGSLFVPFRLAQTASLRRVVPADQLSDAIAFNQGQSFGTSLAGQPIGGFLYSLRPAFPFLADAISYCASLLSVAMMRTPLGAPEGPQDRNLTRELREGLSFAWTHRFIRSTALLTVRGPHHDSDPGPPDGTRPERCDRSWLGASTARSPYGWGSTAVHRASPNHLDLRSSHAGCRGDGHLESSGEGRLGGGAGRCHTSVVVSTAPDRSASHTTTPVDRRPLHVSRLMAPTTACGRRACPLHTDASGTQPPAEGKVRGAVRACRASEKGPTDRDSGGGTVCVAGASVRAP